MDSKHYYSVRMHASAGSVHVSGAERLVTGQSIEQAVSEVLSRAFSKHVGPEHVSISIDDLGPVHPRILVALDVTPLRVNSVDHGKRVALRVLRMAGVSVAASLRAVDLLSRGPAGDGRSMRGAMIMDWMSGERLEPDGNRGVRATRFDWCEEAVFGLQSLLRERSLSHFRTREALALASKIAHGPSVKAEVCWSDDPDYCAGYVASLQTGYVRIPKLKQAGDCRGGRAIFIDRQTVKLEEVLAYLESEPVLLTMPRLFRPETDPDTFFPNPD